MSTFNITLLGYFIAAIITIVWTVYEINKDDEH